MRVIAGAFGGRVIGGSPGKHVRPTTDRAKEALFNKLTHELNFEQLEVLDLFAGSGSLSLECLSRGAKKVVSVDSNKNAIRFMNTLKNDWKIDPQTWQIVHSDALKYMQRNSILSAELILLDPPYDFVNLTELVSHIVMEASVHACIVVEHSSTRTLPELNLKDLRSYGQSSFAFYYGTTPSP